MKISYPCGEEETTHIEAAGWRKECIEPRRGDRLIQKIAVAGFAAALLAACGGTTAVDVVNPDPVRCQLAISAPPRPLPAATSTITLNVTVARECTWTASSEASWVQVSPTSGQGAGPITLTVAANSQTLARSTAVMVNDSRVPIAQDGAPCRFELGPDHLRIAREGARTSLRVSTTEGCEWRASSPAGWVRVLTETGVGPGTVELDVSRNEGPERSITLTVAGLAVTVSQEGSSPNPPVPLPGPNPPACTFALDPESLSFRSPASEGSVRVVTAAGCGWTAASAADWISILTGSGSGPDTVRYRVAANVSTTSDRTGTAVIAGRTHTVRQQACALTLDPASLSFGSPGGEGSIRVVTDAGCTWTATASSDWMSIVSRSSGSGPDTIRYRVGVNASTTTTRTGSVVVSGRTHTALQLAFRPEEISVEGIVSDLAGSCPKFTFTVAGRSFLTDNATEIRGGCSEIRAGVRVHVRGELLPDGRVRATLVDVDD